MRRPMKETNAAPTSRKYFAGVAARLTRIDIRCAKGTCCGTSSQGKEASLAIFLALGTKE